MVNGKGKVKKDMSSINSAKAFKALNDLLEIKTITGVKTLYLDGWNIASFTKEAKRQDGKCIYIREEDIKGYLFINPKFFTNTNPQKRIDTNSDMRNIAKAFFKFNKHNHVALIQYLKADGSSNEHYHSLTEILIQLAGYSRIELRNLDDDSQVQTHYLEAGDIFTILPNTIHRLNTYDEDEGSITIPIKQTNPKRSDHFYPTMSSKRIAKEIDNMISWPHYWSGNEIITSLERFYESLKDDERKNFINYLSSRTEKEKNPNTKKLLGICLANITTGE